MSKPFPGNYFIVNTYNQGLAVTYGNDKLGAPLTVNPFLRSPDQMICSSFSFEIHNQDDHD